MKIASLLILFFGITQMAAAACLVRTSKNGPAPHFADAVGVVLANNPTCPTEVFEFREALKQWGLKLETALVANRGFHNPSQGSFSMFEMAVGAIQGVEQRPGDVFFGHFTAPDDKGQLVADQNPRKNSLMIEAFAWDFKKGYYNFYELRGDGKLGQWFYRGDSADIFADNRFLHRQPAPSAPAFGDRLRCSACHSAGGPVMKELYPPHNDWWEPVRKLNFGGRKPDPKLTEVFATLVPASRLAAAVVLGLKRLEASPKFQEMKSTLSLQEQLRPLFCPVEVNFRSDFAPNPASEPLVRVPSEFFIDSRLGGERLAMARADYTAGLSKLGSRFPETTLPDADHAWHVPVKAKSDKIAVDALIRKGLIDKAFAVAVLSVDFTNPVVSRKRCALLRHVPQDAALGWQKEFLAHLPKSEKTDALLGKCRESLKRPQSVLALLRLADQRRNEVRASEISKNPLGQILEPGFRVIFPVLDSPTAPGRLTLTPECEAI